jgi:hypothetical protein
MRTALVLAGLLAVSGCMAPPSQAQRVTDAARELNVACRFGRMDVALGHTSPGARDQFLERRASWGRQVRVLDVELSGLRMRDEYNAVLHVDVAWVRDSESSMRTTRVAQIWRDGDGGWRLIREQRLSGDLGLFGESVPEPTAQPQRDVQFPTRVIR